MPGRQIVDNIIIYQEVIYSMRKQKPGVGTMLIKIDLEKAYDRLSWKFIRNTLEIGGFPNSSVRKIMKCVETSKVSVSWNGTALDWFQPSGGIRQGDTISPYIFVLCLERIGHIIQPVVDDEKWEPIKLSRYGPNLSHLFFADDLLFFAEASENQIQIIMECLNLFCSMSGQKVSLKKSSIFFSKGVEKTMVEKISNISKIPITTKRDKYLGTPAINGRMYSGLYY